MVTVAGRVWARPDAVAAGMLLLLAAAGLAQRQLGLVPGLVTVAAWSAVVVAVVRWALLSAGGPRIPVTAITALLTAGLVALAAVNLLVPESVDLRADRDDALDLAAAELMGGRDPWAVSTHIHPTHHPSPGLGGVLLAAPFALGLGDSSWQNVFWLMIAVVLLVRVAGWAPALAGAALVWSSPTFWNEWIFQSDLLVLGIKFVVAGLWGLHAMARSQWPARVLSALLFGLVLADRFLFLCFALLIAAVALRRIPWRRCVPWLVLAAITALALLIAPLAWAPAYLDQMTLNLAKGSEAAGGAATFAGPALGVVLLVLALVSGLRSRQDIEVMGAAALLCAVVVGWQVLLYSWSAGAPTFDGTLAVAYTPLMLITGVAALVLPQGNAVTGVVYAGSREQVAEHVG